MHRVAEKVSSRKSGLQEAHRQQDGQRDAQQPDSDYDRCCHPTHGLLAAGLGWRSMSLNSLK
jgi:hypothetical protein